MQGKLRFGLNRGSGRRYATHSLFLQVVSRLLVFVFRQLLIAIAIVLSNDGLNLCIRVALPEDGREKPSEHTHVSTEI